MITFTNAQKGNDNLPGNFQQTFLFMHHRILLYIFSCNNLPQSHIRTIAYLYMDNNVLIVKNYHFCILCLFSKELLIFLYICEILD